MAHKDPYDHNKEIIMIRNIEFLLTISLTLLLAKVPNDDPMLDQTNPWSKLCSYPLKILPP